ncbi:uncharacterized protein LOC107422745 [Ziziphus jujuba]|nr:uncharacterized protein LOC107422745 [Ziziphus jujuba]
MEFFHKAESVRLRSHHEKYLLAQEDGETVRQDRNGAHKRAQWNVEFVTGSDSVIRFKSCYGKYLTASTEPFLKGLSSCQKVLQTLPSPLDSTVEWEPIRDGEHIRLMSRYSHSFLRGSGGLPPWRKSVTHYPADDETEKSSLEWDVDIVGIHQGTKAHRQPPPQAPRVPVKGKTPSHPHASVQGNMTYMQYAQVGVDAGNVAVDVGNLMTHVVDEMEDAEGDGDAMGDEEGDLEAPEVEDASGFADAAEGLMGDALDMASNCLIM